MKKGVWIVDKLNQNGYTPQDLADQTGLSLEQVQSLINDETADQSEWDLVLSTMNNYPAVRYPGNDLFDDLEQDQKNYDEDQAVTIFYGVNQKELIFCGYQVEGSMDYHGANVDYQSMFRLHTTLKDAAKLFQEQRFVE